MYIMYYDSGTTNTRGYLLKDGVIVQRDAKAIGAKNSALEKDNSRLVGELYSMYRRLIEAEGIQEADVRHVYLSGMISSPSGLVEVEHVSVPVSSDILRKSMVTYQDELFFKRELEIIPGVKTLGHQELADQNTAAFVNMMRGEEIETFGILKSHPELKAGECVLVLPGSHTQAIWMKNGTIMDISSNITGELYKAIIQETILGASVSGDEPWGIDAEMVCLGGNNVHKYGFNRALYILRILDLFTENSLNRRRSYLEGVLNVGVMDAVSKMLACHGAAERKIPLVVAGDVIQKAVYAAFCDRLYPGFLYSCAVEEPDIPFSVSGLLALLEA